MPRVAVHTLGCKLNYAETSWLAKQFVDRGFELVELGQPADVCVINTCSVTERADRECRQIIRRALRTSDNPFVVVTGCYAQLEPGHVAAIKGVDLVLGTKEKFELFDHVGGLEKKLYPDVFVSGIDTVNNFGAAYSTTAGDRTRAFLKVQDGCDYNCSFCTIPLARGASRSQSIGDCIAQARDLVAQGFREIVLTGVNVGDYGRNVGASLLSLLERLVEVEGLDRIRISSIEPNLLTREILEFVAVNDRMCKHFHLPLQSGSPEMLRHMRRRYTTDDYADLVRRIRGRIHHCGIGADVIVGFPGESEQHFAETYQFLADLNLSYLHVFTYSERPNTPAAAYASQVEPKVRFRRNEVLRTLGLKKKQAAYARMLGCTSEALMEGDVKDGLRFGFTDNYTRVAVPAELCVENTIITVLLEELKGDFCLGRIAHEVAA